MAEVFKFPFCGKKGRKTSLKQGWNDLKCTIKIFLKNNTISFLIHHSTKLKMNAKNKTKLKIHLWVNFVHIPS